MSKTIQSKGELYLTENQFNNRDSSGTLEEGVEYNIIDSVGYATAKYVDDKVSTKTSVTVNGSNVATFDADTKLDKVSGSSNRYKVYGTGTDPEGSFRMWSLVNYPTNGSIPLINPRQTITVDPSFKFSGLLDSDVINKKYVDTAISNNTLSAGAGITIADKTINLDYDTLNSDSISSSSGHLLVNTSYIASNICGNGLYVDGCNSVLSVNWESIPIDVNSPIHFGSCNQGLTLSIDSSTFYIDSCNGLQINSGNNLLDIGLYGNYGSSYIHESYNTLTILSESIEMDATSSNGQIAIQGNNDVLVHNGIFGLAIKSSNNIILGAYSSNNIDTSGPYIEVTHDFAKIAFGNSFYLEVNANGVSINGNPIN